MGYRVIAILMAIHAGCLGISQTEAGVCPQVTRILALSTRMSETARAFGESLIQNPQAKAASHQKEFELNLSNLRQLEVDLDALAKAVPQMTEAEAQQAFVLVYDRLVLSDTFGAHIYWAEKGSRTPTINIKALDQKLEEVVSALGEKLRDSEGSDIVNGLVTNFIVSGFTYARLTDRSPTFDEIKAIKARGTPLTPAEQAISRALGWNKERKESRRELEKLVEHWRDD